MSNKKDPYMLDSNKLLWHMDRVHAWERGERIAPILIDIGATKICNIRCKYCYGIYQKFEKGTYIQGHTLIQLFKDAPKLGVRALTLTGDGEPTLNPCVYDACIAGYEGGLDIGIATNGVKLNEEKITTLVDTCKWIRFNLSAASQESYKDMHGVDQYFTVVRNIADAVRIKRDLKSDVTIGVQMVLVPDCLDQVVPLAKLSNQLGVDYCVIKQFSDPGADIPCGGYDFKEFYKKAEPVLKEAEKLSSDKTMVKVKWDIMGLNNERAYSRCIDLPFIFQISGNGKCYPCGYLFNNDEYCYGDLHEQSLGEIIKSDKYWGIIDKISKMDTKDLCSGCCRHDSTNQWLTKYMDKPRHINFI